VLIRRRNERRRAKINNHLSHTPSDSGNGCRGTLDLSKVQIQGLEWKPAGTQSEIQAAYAAANRGGSVVIMHAQRNQHKTVGRAAKGMYSIMESLHGNYMHDQLRKLDELGSTGYAKWLTETAKACFSGLGDINNTVLGRLDRNQTLTSLSRPNVARTVGIIESVREQPTLAALARAMYLLATEGEGMCYAHEAWFDMAKSIERASIDETRDPNEHLAVIRNRLRYAGRRSREKLLSKTSLVKDLNTITRSSPMPIISVTINICTLR
jgi:hypothetical protein